MIGIDDRSIAMPPYSGPNKTKLPERQVSEDALDDVLKGIMVEVNESEKGGKGSGNFGHAGRPGHVGGSAPDGGVSSFDTSEWSSIDIPSRIEKWESLTARQRDRMTNAAERVPANQKSLISHAGDRPEFSGDVKKSITNRIDQLVMVNGEEFIPGKDAKMIHQTVNELDDSLAALNVDPKLRHQLAMEAADALVAQDRESLGRILGDHGVHHLRGNIETAMSIIEAHPDVDTPNDIAETYLAQVFHDTGYMTDPSRMFLDMGHARWSAQHYDANIRPTVEKALGKRAAGEISHIIRTHASTDVDWEEDLLASANRVADNMALFHREKLPPLFRLVPTSTSVLEDIGTGKVSISRARNMLRRKVRDSNLSRSIKKQLLGAVGEINPISPKVILGMLGGSLGKVEWKGNRLLVRLRRNAEATRLQKVLDLGQRQFAKFAKVYGYDASHFLESLQFEFKNPEGQTVLESIIEEEKMLEALKALGLSKAEREEVVSRIKAVAGVHPVELTEALKGGPGSGNYGHSGRPGQRGGSAPSSGMPMSSGLPKGHAERARANRLGVSESEVGFAEVPGSSFVSVRSIHLPKKYHPFVTPYSADEYKEMRAKLFISESGKSGYALKPDGDIISVFSSPDVKEGSYALMSAIANGGSKLDCFDGFLAQKFYPRFGFKEYDRWTWDDQYAPKGWNYDEFNRPDVVFMNLSEVQ